MTVSELERELSINKSAIFRHLVILQEAGLISKRKNENEFVYYELTQKGKDATDQNGNNKIVILLTISGFVFILGLFTLYESVEKFIKPQFWSEIQPRYFQIILGSMLILSAVFILFFGIKKKEN